MFCSLLRRRERERKEEKTAPRRRLPNLPHAFLKRFRASLITRISESDAGGEEPLLKFTALWFPSACGSISLFVFVLNEMPQEQEMSSSLAAFTVQPPRLTPVTSDPPEPSSSQGPSEQRIRIVKEMRKQLHFFLSYQPKSLIVVYIIDRCVLRKAAGLFGLKSRFDAFSQHS